MAYDEDLAERAREQLAERTDFDERKMLGGLAFMVDTQMALRHRRRRRTPILPTIVK